MKKFVATTTSAVVAIVLVGVGSMSALAGTAAAAPGPTTTKVCAQLAVQANNILTPMANAVSADTAAQSALHAAQTALTADLATFVASIVPVIHDLDASITNPTHMNAFNTAENNFVTDFVNVSNDQVTAFNTGKTLSQLQMQQSTISQLQSALCG
jgi:hypothetical protein